jgi:hypothetical protein
LKEALRVHREGHKKPRLFQPFSYTLMDRS